MTRDPYHPRAWSVERLHRAIGSGMVTRLQASAATGIPEDRITALLHNGAEPTDAERTTIAAWADQLERGESGARGIRLA